MDANTAQGSFVSPEAIAVLEMLFGIKRVYISALRMIYLIRNSSSAADGVRRSCEIENYAFTGDTDPNQCQFVVDSLRYGGSSHLNLNFREFRTNNHPRRLE